MIEEKWKNKLFTYYNHIEKSFSKGLIFGCFLHGSQNYNLADEYSDVDANCFFISSNRNLRYDAICSEENDRIMFSNISLLLKKIRLQTLNANYAEYLLTDYFIINPLFEKAWIELKSISEEIVESNRNNIISSLYRGYQQDFNTLLSWPNRAKCASHLYREKATLLGLQAGLSIKDALQLKHLSEPERQFIIDIKRKRVSWKEQDCLKLCLNSRDEPMGQELKGRIEDILLKIEGVKI